MLLTGTKSLLACVIAMVLLVSGCDTGESTSPSDEEVLTKLLHEFLEGASANDPEAHDRFWAEDLIYTGSAGTRATKQDIMSEITTPATPVDGELPKYGAEYVQVRVYDDAAVVAFRLTGTTDDERMEYFNTGTFLKRDGEWRAVAWQATKIPAK